ncbi:hypothetical protein BCAR13_1350013 [Paraburkholderia caribensis]|nr:hypothetical protein BCAR13_1350013 [Paraburkholderia caribensis]
MVSVNGDPQRTRCAEDACATKTSSRRHGVPLAVLKAGALDGLFGRYIVYIECPLLDTLRCHDSPLLALGLHTRVTASPQTMCRNHSRGDIQHAT